MRFAILAPLAGLAVLAGCVPRAETPQPDPTPAPTPVRPALPAPPLPPPPGSDWRDWALTPGSWRYAADTRGSSATFGEAGVPKLTLRCDKGGNAVYLTRTGQARGSAFTVRTSTATRALPVQPAAGATPALTAVLRPDDRLLDAIGFSRGRFVLETPPLGPLVVPAWAEILRVVEDCRG